MGIPVLALVFGLALVGCPTDDDDPKVVTPTGNVAAYIAEITGQTDPATVDTYIGIFTGIVNESKTFGDVFDAVLAGAKLQNPETNFDFNWLFGSAKLEDGGSISTTTPVTSDTKVVGNVAEYILTKTGQGDTLLLTFRGIVSEGKTFGGVFEAVLAGAKSQDATTDFPFQWLFGGATLANNTPIIATTPVTSLTVIMSGTP